LSEEEKLASEAVQKIRSWLEKETEGRGGEFSSRLAVKFCGGCNPVLERGELAQGGGGRPCPDHQWMPHGLRREGGDSEEFKSLPGDPAGGRLRYWKKRIADRAQGRRRKNWLADSLRSWIIDWADRRETWRTGNSRRSSLLENLGKKNAISLR
jgi:hypothetical protein